MKARRYATELKNDAKFQTTVSGVDSKSPCGMFSS